MPELPEVETTLRGLKPHLLGRRIEALVVRQPRLRWPIPLSLADEVTGRFVQRLERRAKYLLLDCGPGWLIYHLGMSGSLRLVDPHSVAGPHDHVDLVLDSGRALRLHDPRRFGAVLWQPGDAQAHRLLSNLGPEPLLPGFTARWMQTQALGRRSAVKAFLMDSRVVCGVGNIYASEALFRAGIHPRRAAGRISLARWERLVAAVRETLADAIEAGGSSLRDFVHVDGSAGHFQVRTQVYGREGEPCRRCGQALRQIRIAGRSSFYCAGCQH